MICFHVFVNCNSNRMQTYIARLGIVWTGHSHVFFLVFYHIIEAQILSLMYRFLTFHSQLLQLFYIRLFNHHLMKYPNFTRVFCT